MMKIHLLILFAQFDQLIAVPGKAIAKTICSWYNMCRFDLNPIDGMQHILLDNLYTDYFLDNSATEQRLIMLKIAICTHVYMMRWTIEQNMDKLSKMRTFRPVPDGHDDDGAGTSNKAGENAYIWLCHELTL
uniref:NR LBD domain-containing protein n=1 Tax=Globodera pallida TaxID=36090 RepID=A0A183CM66_GLOPA